MEQYIIQVVALCVNFFTPIDLEQVIIYTLIGSFVLMLTSRGQFMNWASIYRNFKIQCITNPQTGITHTHTLSHLINKVSPLTLHTSLQQKCYRMH